MKPKPPTLIHSEQRPAVLDYRQGKKYLELIPKKGNAFDRCASFSETYMCCRIHVLKAVQNCPFDCSYCFLQSYLNQPVIRAVTDVPAMIQEVKEQLALQPKRFFRIGTWELGDSLALEKQVGQAEQLVRAFASLPSVFLELKTKSNEVDFLLNIPHQKHTVVSWSLNPEKIVRKEEHRTASLRERLEAIRKVQEAGYWIGLHFDPMILVPDWKQLYAECIQGVFDVVDTKKVVWISMGSLRFPQEMKHSIAHYFPSSEIPFAEMVMGEDKKMRYLKPVRIQMYQFLRACILKYGSSDPFLYLCMESKNVWERVFGWAPESSAHCDYLLAKSLYQRFPESVGNLPSLEDYVCVS